MSDKEDVPQITQITKLFLCGYIRDMQSILPSGRFYNIPSMVAYLVFDYYHQRDFFRKKHKRDLIKMDNTKSIASLGNVDPVSVPVDHKAYGSVLIDFTKSSIYSWDIKILKLEQKYYAKMITIGITADSSKFDRICYAYSNYGLIRAGNGKVANLKYAEPFQVNDIIRINIDTKECTLQYLLNNFEYTEKMKPNFTAYYFTVSMKRNCSVQLLKFNHTIIQ